MIGDEDQRTMLSDLYLHNDLEVEMGVSGVGGAGVLVLRQGGGAGGCCYSCSCSR